MRLVLTSLATPTGISSMPSAFAFSTSAASSGAFSIMWPNGSPGATSPSKVRKVGRMASCSRLSVITMSRIGCAPPATASQTPIVSNSRRAAATIAEARASAGVAGERRIGDRDRERRPEPLAQRNRQRQTGESRAADQDVDAPRV